jgi:Flp pilus assembly protein TadG
MPAHEQVTIRSRLHKRCGRTRHLRRGSEILELALLFLPLLWLTFGAVDFGYYFYLQHNLQGAAHAGARAGIVGSATNANVKDAVDAVMKNAGFTDSGKYTTTIETPVDSVAAGADVKVTVEMPYTPLGVPPARVSATKVKSTVTMRKEES